MRIVHASPTRATVACNTCESRFAVEVGELGPEFPKTERCHIEGCENELCPECLEQPCFGCNEPTCRFHLVEVGGDLWCPCCIAEIVAEGEAALEEVA